MFRTDTPPRTRWENVNISNIPDTGSITQLTVGRTISGKQTRPFILKPYWTWESLVIMTFTRHWHIPALLRYLPPWVFQHQVKVSSSRLEELGRRAASKQNRAHDLLMITQTGVSPGQPGLRLGAESGVNTCNKTGSGHSHIVNNFDWSRDWHGAEGKHNKTVEMKIHFSFPRVKKNINMTTQHAQYFILCRAWSI